MAFIDPTDMLHSAPLHGWSGSFFHSQRMTFGLWEVAADADPLHDHSHPQEEVWNVAEGEIAITVDSEEHVLRPGSAVVIPPNVLHSARPIGYCRVVVADCPRRTELHGLDR